jgi:hypothetical protein
MPDDPEGLDRPVYFLADVADDVAQYTGLGIDLVERVVGAFFKLWDDLDPPVPLHSWFYGVERLQEQWIVEAPAPFAFHRQDGSVDEEVGQLYGRQVHLGTAGRADLVHRYPARSAWLVVELKRGPITDAAVDQLERYIDAAQQRLAQPGEKVAGALIGFGTTLTARRRIYGNADVDFFSVTVMGELATRPAPKRRPREPPRSAVGPSAARRTGWPTPSACARTCAGAISR